MKKREKVWITNAAAITALGETLSDLWSNLLKGKTAIKPVRRFETGEYNSKVAGCIDKLSPDGKWSMTRPIIDRLFNETWPIPSDVEIITATTKAGIDNLEILKQGGDAKSRDVLLNSLPKIVKSKFGLKKEGFNISAACASSTIAIARGASMIASGINDAVLICCADAVTEFVFSGFSCLKALSPGPCRPFDRGSKRALSGRGSSGFTYDERKSR